MFIESQRSATKAPEERHVSRIRRSAISAHDDLHYDVHLMGNQEHAAPLGLVIVWGTMGYKQAAPTELKKRAEVARA